MILSDIRTREVNILWLLLFCATQIYFFGIGNSIVNLFLILFMFLGVYGYLLFRYGLKSKLTQFLGMGDILFIITLTPSFALREFTYFLIVGFLFSIFCWFLMHRKKSIPLVSTLGFVYLIWLLIKMLPYE